MHRGFLVGGPVPGSRVAEMSKPVCAIVGIGPKNGRAFATRFADEGYAVALLSRSTDYSATLAEELGGRAYACDVTDPDAIASAFERIRTDLGDVDVLLYNVGSGQFGTFDDVPDEEFVKGWKINVRGPLQSTRPVVGPMRANRKDGVASRQAVHGRIRPGQSGSAKLGAVPGAAARPRGYSRGARHRRRWHRHRRPRGECKRASPERHCRHRLPSRKAIEVGLDLRNRGPSVQRELVRRGV